MKANLPSLSRLPEVIEASWIASSSIIFATKVAKDIPLRVSAESTSASFSREIEVIVTPDGVSVSSFLMV